MVAGSAMLWHYHHPGDPLMISTPLRAHRHHLPTIAPHPTGVVEPDIAIPLTLIVVGSSAP